MHQNLLVPKIPSSQILAANLERLMGASADLKSQNALAKRAKVAQSHIGRICRQESAATVDMLDAIADAFGVESWELLTDTETTRRNAIEKMLLGPRISDQRAAELLPPAPRLPKKRKKKQ